MTEVRLTSHILEVGGRIIQIKNISEVGIFVDLAYRNQRKRRVRFAILVLLLEGWLFAPLAQSQMMSQSIITLLARAGVSASYLDEAERLLRGFFAIGHQLGWFFLGLTPEAWLAGLVLAPALLVWGLVARPTYRLMLQTNSGRLSLLASTRLAIMQDLVAKLKTAMSDTSGNINHHWNIDAREISVRDSTGVVMTGSHGSVNQTIY